MTDYLFEMKKATSGLIKTILEGASSGNAEFNRALMAVENTWDSPELQRFRESYGKMALMMPAEIQSRQYFSKLTEAMGYMGQVRTFARIDPQLALGSLGALHTSLEVIQHLVPSIDEAFRNQEGEE